MQMKGALTLDNNSAAHAKQVADSRGSLQLWEYKIAIDRDLPRSMQTVFLHIFNHFAEMNVVEKYCISSI